MAPVVSAVPLLPLLVLPGGAVIPVHWETIARDAMVQGYKVRNRQRWATDGDLDASMDSPLSKVLTPNDLSRIAKAGVVEVSIPWSDSEGEAWGWPARIMPWEFVLSAATRPYRDGPLTVIRRLNTGPHRRPTQPLLQSALLIAAAPGALADLYDLSQETRLVRASLGLPEADDRIHVISQPDERRLQEAIAEHHPGLIHYAGFDNHQAASLLGDLKRFPSTTGDAKRDPSALDGLVLTASNRAPLYKEAEAIAMLLAGTAQPATLVALNAFYSAARVAPRIIAQGAAHAIGFQDTIDDRLAEHFFATLYRELSSDPLDVFGAFRASLDVLRTSPKRLRGVGVVLWSAESLVAGMPAVPITRRSSASARFPAASTLPVSEQVEVICQPWDEMNYSLLHNGRSPFKHLQIMRRQVSGPIANVNVSVTMYVGEESFPFVKTLTIGESEPMADLTDKVVVPLTSALLRTQSEKIRSVLAVEVRIGSEIVHRETYRMALAPVDQWSDTDEDRLWLPSFVLPRDPKVATIVQSARNYLIAIEDDPSAGFDGYQSVGSARLPFAERYKSVDDQVNAIWCALLLDRPLLYINPPPSYADPASSKDAPQRLRTPSEIVQGGHGTCIDLALLLCACLEYVDIWPVIFLLEGHAFPGYWRSEALHDGFQHFKNLEDVKGDQLRGGSASARLEESYTVPKTSYLEVKTIVERGHLVPLEAVWLTNHSSFAESMAEGLANLRSEREFNSMIDVHAARDKGIAPLPILWRPS